MTDMMSRYGVPEVQRPLLSIPCGHTLENELKFSVLVQGQQQLTPEQREQQVRTQHPLLSS